MASPRLAKLMEWMRRNLREPHSLGSLAEQAALSQRTLQRQFLEATGLSPIDWLIRERVAFARELLETTDRPLQWIAEQAGFGSQESFRRHFRGRSMRALPSTAASIAAVSVRTAGGLLIPGSAGRWPAGLTTGWRVDGSAALRQPDHEHARQPSKVCNTTGAIGAAASGCATGKRVSVSFMPGTNDSRKLKDSANVDR
jgi:AraC-like DNA-binding protein